MVRLSLLQHRFEALLGHATRIVDEVHDGKRCCTYKFPQGLRTTADTRQLIDHLRTEGESDDVLLSRLLLCRFLATSALIVLARSEDNIERAVTTWGVPFRQTSCLS